MCVCMHAICVKMPAEARGVVTVPGTRDADGYVLPNMCFGNQTLKEEEQALLMLSHLSSLAFLLVEFYSVCVLYCVCVHGCR